MATTHPERPKDIASIRNTIERRANLIVDMLEDRAQHIVDSMDEPPPGEQEPTPDMIRAMWQFSPFGTRGPLVFWMLHDLAFQKAMEQIVSTPGLSGDERLKAIRSAAQKAESDALSRTYPHRAAIMKLGVTTPEQSVKLAQHAQRLVDQEQKRQGQEPQEQPVAEEAMAYG